VVRPGRGPIVGRPGGAVLKGRWGWDASAFSATQHHLLTLTVRRMILYYLPCLQPLHFYHLPCLPAGSSTWLLLQRLPTAVGAPVGGLLFWLFWLLLLLLLLLLCVVTHCYYCCIVNNCCVLFICYSCFVVVVTL